MQPPRIPGASPTEHEHSKVPPASLRLVPTSELCSHLRILHASSSLRTASGLDLDLDLDLDPERTAPIPATHSHQSPNFNFCRATPPILTEHLCYIVHGLSLTPAPVFVSLFFFFFFVSVWLRVCLGTPRLHNGGPSRRRSGLCNGSWGSTVDAKPPKSKQTANRQPSIAPVERHIPSR